MRTRMVFVALTLALAVGPSARAQGVSDAGTILRIDPPSRVVTLEDGRMYRAVPGTSFRVDDASISFAELQPGTRVAVDGAEPVVYRKGKYIVLPAVAAPAIGGAMAPSIALPAPYASPR
jgi:hypothetical protein